MFMTPRNDSESTSWALSLGFLLITTSLLSIAFYATYNIFFHPLRKYPGPILCKAFRLPFVITYIGGQLPRGVLQLHKTYGPVVRIAPDELAFANGQAYQDIYGLQPDRSQNERDDMIFTPAEPGAKETIGTSDAAVHSRLRKLYAPAFSGKAVEEYSDALVKYADLLVSRLKESSSSSSPIQDVHQWYSYAGFDIMGDFAFGEDFRCLLDRRSHFFMNTITPGIIAATNLNQLERYGIYSFMKPFIPRSAMRAKYDLEELVNRLVSKRIERGAGKGRDVFHYLLEDAEGRSLSKNALEQNGVIIVMAGSHTTITLLSAATYLLAKDPSRMRRARKEVREAFESDGEITVKAALGLPYVNAVINEALRLVPGGPFGLPRWIDKSGGQMVAGYHVPAKTRVSVYQWAIGRLESNFARADEFIPERWLTDAPEDFAQGDHRAFEPFNVGPRGCIGKGSANAEARILFVKMMWHFDLELADPEDDWIEGVATHMIYKKPSLMMRLKPRGS